jgi:DNA-binding NarL/FixJ family response regulator
VERSDEVKPAVHKPVVMIASGGELTSNLRRLCEANCWLSLSGISSIEALRRVRLCHAIIIVVQLSPDDRGWIDMLSLLSTEARGSTLIGIAAGHEDEIEQQARAAGAHLYFSNDAQTSDLERVIREILERHATSSPKCLPVRPVRTTANSSSPPSLLRPGRRA